MLKYGSRDEIADYYRLSEEGEKSLLGMTNQSTIYKIKDTLGKVNKRIDEIGEKVSYMFVNDPTSSSVIGRHKGTILSIAIPSLISLALGLTTAHYRFDFEREISKRPLDFSSGMPTGVANTGNFTGKPLFDFGNINPFSYAPPVNHAADYAAQYFPLSQDLIEVNHEALTGYQQNTLAWRNVGGGIIEHIPAWLASGVYNANKLLKRGKDTKWK